MTITDRIGGLSAAVAIKAPCRVATTANITLAGLQTIDGIAVATGDRVLVKEQTDQTKNGIYDANSSTWTRAKDFNGPRDAVTGTLVFVLNGTVNTDTFWRVTSTDDPISFGTSNITFGASSNQVFGMTAFVETLIDDLTNSDFMETLGFSIDGQAMVTAANFAAMRTNLGLAIGVDVQAFDADILKADTADVLTAGFAMTPDDQGTVSGGTYTPDEADGNFQYYVNGAAHVFAPPSNNCSLVIQCTNNASAGAIDTSGFTLADGDVLTTTNGDDFLFYVTKINGFSRLTVVALQ